MGSVIWGLRLHAIMKNVQSRAEVAGRIAARHTEEPGGVVFCRFLDSQDPDFVVYAVIA